LSRRGCGPGRTAHPVDSGTAELVHDPDRPSGWTLVLDGTPQSHVDLADPTYLQFEYVRVLGHVVDLCAEPGRALDVVHLGAGALTLPRYVAATRPGSRQRAFEADAALLELVRRKLPLPTEARLRVRTDDARKGLASLRGDTADLLVSDVYAGARTPAHLTSVEVMQHASRVLRPGGTYAVNLADGPPLTFARAQLATLRSVFAHVCCVADPAVLRHRRFGNLVAVASAEGLPLAELSRRTASDPMPTRVLHGAPLERLVGSAPVVTDASAVDSPLPPDDTFGRR
jgi:spermidine synthase